LIQLIREKESIQAKLEKVDASIATLENGRASGRRSIVPSKKGRRGKNLKDGLLKVLSAAGKSGLSVKELSAELKAKPQSIHAWFYTTGKKIKGIKKVGRGRFAYIP